MLTFYFKYDTLQRVIKMKMHVFRLTYGMDLRQGIIEYCKKNEITSAVLLTCAGCVNSVSLRPAALDENYREVGHFEIVSLTGTIAENGIHFHASFSDSTCRTIGGHLMDGCLVNTTAEIALMECEELLLKREFDEETGYHELTASEKR